MKTKFTLNLIIPVIHTDLGGLFDAIKKTYVRGSQPVRFVPFVQVDRLFEGHAEKPTEDLEFKVRKNFSEDLVRQSSNRIVSFRTAIEKLHRSVMKKELLRLSTSVTSDRSVSINHPFDMEYLAQHLCLRSRAAKALVVRIAPRHYVMVDPTALILCHRDIVIDPEAKDWKWKLHVEAELALLKSGIFFLKIERPYSLKTYIDSYGQTYPRTMERNERSARDD